MRLTNLSDGQKDEQDWQMRDNHSRAEIDFMPFSRVFSASSRSWTSFHLFSQLRGRSDLLRAARPAQAFIDFAAKRLSAVSSNLIGRSILDHFVSAFWFSIYRLIFPSAANRSSHLLAFSAPGSLA